MLVLHCSCMLLIKARACCPSRLVYAAIMVLTQRLLVLQVSAKLTTKKSLNGHANGSKGDDSYHSDGSTGGQKALNGRGASKGDSKKDAKQRLLQQAFGP
jgi:hypothetical protein